MDIQNCDEMIKACEAGMAVIRELDEYRQIGTVAVCRAAFEKIKPKRPSLIRTGFVLKAGETEEKETYGWKCPLCGDTCLTKYENYCSYCGQALDWTESESD